MYVQYLLQVFSNILLPIQLFVCKYMINSICVNSIVQINILIKEIGGNHATYAQQYIQYNVYVYIQFSLL